MPGTLNFWVINLISLSDRTSSTTCNPRSEAVHVPQLISVCISSEFTDIEVALPVDDARVVFAACM